MVNFKISHSLCVGGLQSLWTMLKIVGAPTLGFKWASAAVSLLFVWHILNLLVDDHGLAVGVLGL